MTLLTTLKKLLGLEEEEDPSIYLTPQELAITPMPPESVPPGDSVNSTFHNAIALARKHQRPVKVNVNRLKLVLVDPQSTVEEMMVVFDTAERIFDQQGEDAAKAYLDNTPERQRLYEARHGSAEFRIETLQQHMDTLLEDLPSRLASGTEATIAWIGSFSKTVNQISVGYRRDYVLQQFLAHGYDKELRHDQRQCAAGLANRIIGTTLQQLEELSTVHRYMAKECAEYIHQLRREQKQSG